MQFFLELDLYHNIAGRAVKVFRSLGLLCSCCYNNSAVRGVVGELMAQRPHSLLIANRTVSRARSLRERFDAYPNIRICGFDELAAAGRFDVIINAVPAGLTAALPPLPDDLARGCCCYDMVYGDATTPFVAWAVEHGARTASDGLGMLVEQAAESFFIWRGVRPETVPVIDMLRRDEE